ncbi:hypothetical protein ACFV6U_40405, partial [Streptomyces sp. NPDC059810]
VYGGVPGGAALLFPAEHPAAGQPAVDEEPAGPGAGRGAAHAAAEPASPVLLGLDRYALAEESLADGLARLVKTATADTWEGSELERAAGAHGLVLHTGGEASRAEPVALAAGRPPPRRRTPGARRDGPRWAAARPPPAGPPT